MFPYANPAAAGGIYRAVLNFSFRGIDFSKKRVLPFFLALELLTNQKCVVTQSSRNVLAWKLRKGMMVGCKVTLRGNSLYDFLDSLQLTLPRMEKLQTVRLGNRSRSNALAIRLAELVLFYPIELGLGLHSDVQRVEVNLLFRSLSREEKLFLLTSSKIPVHA
jgi:large subunit ribosomal protein L5